MVVARSAQAQHERMMAEIGHANIPGKYAELTLETWRNTTKALEKVQAYTKVCTWVQAINDGKLGRPWLFLLGKTRRGKTGLGIGALKALMLAGRTGAFVTAYDMLDAVKARFGGDTEAYTEALARVDVLMIDEIITEKLTDWRRDVLFALIWRRDAERKITIITTAAGNDTWIPALSEAGIARIDENSVRVVIEGKPLRYGQDGEIWN